MAYGAAKLRRSAGRGGPPVPLRQVTRGASARAGYPPDWRSARELTEFPRRE